MLATVSVRLFKGVWGGVGVGERMRARYRQVWARSGKSGQMPSELGLIRPNVSNYSRFGKIRPIVGSCGEMLAAGVFEASIV